MNLLQFGLKPLKISDKPTIDTILNARNTMLSAYAFASHYIWRDIFHFYWGIIDGYLCLFAGYDDYIYIPVPPVLAKSPPHPYPLPFGERGSNHILSTVFAIMDTINKNKSVSHIENIDEQEVDCLTSLGYEIRPGESEYLYLREDLANLKGNPYKSKRAMCNYFVKRYRYAYEPFEPHHSVHCITLFNKWKGTRDKKIHTPFYHALLEDTLLSHMQAIKHYKSLQLTGRVVRINDQVEGYIFGFTRGKDIFYILMEVTNTDIKGLSQFIFREFCREMDGHIYINTLGDSGLENLRHVKLSYRPFRVVPTYIACRAKF
ncbi:MAG: DUF2156 domain-containing protein [Nitrospirae bacterium]|nr:DUF2156 domain-containing protein [Nitrospirota bacterium]